MGKYFILLFAFIWFFSINESHCQQIESLTERNTFNLRGTVRYKQSFAPIKDVVVLVNGGSYTKTDFNGDFNITVRLGDELTLEHSDFETVNYTIRTNDRVLVEVEEDTRTKSANTKVEVSSEITFNSLIDSVNVYLKTDIEKSIDFVAKALNQSRNTKNNAEAYEILGDVYMHWKQYDLAISNFKISLQNNIQEEVKLKLGKAYRFLPDLQQSLKTYSNINTELLSNWQKILLYEGYGDIYMQQQKFDLAIDNYKKALSIAEANAIRPKITNLTSKTAQAYDESGSENEAKKYFSSSMNLAEKETVERAVEEKQIVADFQGKNKDYNQEIELRKGIINQIRESKLDSLVSNESSLTPQKQNYKIGTAYFLSDDNANAISYLEKSINEADRREDLVVKKDGLKKLSDVYENSGEFIKAKETFEKYIKTVDELYIKREQEISQAARFRQKIIDNQSRINSLEMDKKLSETAFKLTEEKSKRQQLIIYSLVAGLLLVLALTYLMYKNIKQQKYANNILALKSLRSQMNPHFIFNALNSVNSFIALSDERTANKYLTDFSYLMRAVLENSEEDFIPLKQEIELINLYVKLEHFRFKDKFDYSINIDPNIILDEYEIPPMLLQPYIENAVWHGLRYKKEKGLLKINFSAVDKGTILITVLDDGIGRKKSRELKTDSQLKHKSTGLSNIYKRISILNEMYKDKISVDIIDKDSGENVGTEVVVTLKKM